MFLILLLRHIGWMILGFVTPVFLGAAYQFCDRALVHTWHYGQSAFNREQWLADSGSDRYRMVRDLQYYYLADGLPEAEVLSLLGSPDHRNKQTIEYNIGSSGLLAGDEYLCFSVDEQGRITTFYLR